MALARLDRPPIVEVVCGVAFESIARLDPVTIGAYSRDRAGDYPVHELHPVLAEAGERIFIGPSPLRVWLVSADEQCVLQLQHDRFYLNWRKREAEYPRFNDYEGNLGLLSKALAEFDEFAKFCAQSLGVEPQPTRIELAKVDHFTEGQHWEGMQDLSALVPAIRGGLEIASSDDATMVALQIFEQSQMGLVTASIGPFRAPSGARALSLETRIVAPTTGGVSLSAAFKTANDELNRLFSRIVPNVQRQRFMKGTP